MAYTLFYVPQRLRLRLRLVLMVTVTAIPPFDTCSAITANNDHHYFFRGRKFLLLPPLSFDDHWLSVSIAS